MNSRDWRELMHEYNARDRSERRRRWLCIGVAVALMALAWILAGRNG